MAVTPDHLLNQTGTIYTAGSQDRFGKNTYASGIAYRCRFMQTNRIMQTPNGEKTPIDGVVTVSASAVVAANDKFRFNSMDYRVMMIAPAIDGAGVTRHQKLMVQKWNLK